MGRCIEINFIPVNGLLLKNSQSLVDDFIHKNVRRPSLIDFEILNSIFFPLNSSLYTSLLPSNEATPPGETSTECCEDDQIPLLDRSITDRFIQGNGDGCRRDVSVLLNGEINFFNRDIQPLGHLLKHAQVGLMRDDPLYIGDFDAIKGSRFFSSLRETFHGYPNGFIGLNHPQGMKFLINTFVGNRGGL